MSGFPTLLIGLEVDRLHHHEIVPVDLGVGHALLFSLLLLLLPLALLELGPFHTVLHLAMGNDKSVVMTVARVLISEPTTATSFTDPKPPSGLEDGAHLIHDLPGVLGLSLQLHQQPFRRDQNLQHSNQHGSETPHTQRITEVPRIAT